MSDKETRTVSIDPENDDWLQNQDNASAVVNELVEQARKTGNIETAALDLQKRQKKRELELSRQKTQNLEQDIEEIEETKKQLSNYEDAKIEEAKEALPDGVDDPANPGVENWAAKLGMTPTELLNAIQD